MSRLDKLLKTLANAPAAQIDAKVTNRIARLVGCTNEVVCTELNEIRVENEHSTLVTPFAMEVISQAIEVSKIKD